MRIIGRTLKSTPLKWLPVLSNIVPPNIRKEQALIREWTKIANNPNLPIHMDLRVIEGRLRCKSRKPLWVTANGLLLENVTENTKWHKD